MILSFLVGSLWGIFNLVMIRWALKSFLIEKNKLKTFLLLLLKFPLLYGIGYLFLKSEYFDLLSLISGFSFILLASMVRSYVFAKN